MELGKIFFAAIGLLFETRRRFEELSDELVERGRLREKGSGELLDKLVDKAAGERREAGKIMREILRDAFESAGAATDGDTARIRERLALLENSLEKTKRNKAADRLRKSNTGKKGTALLTRRPE